MRRLWERRWDWLPFVLLALILATHGWLLLTGRVDCTYSARVVGKLTLMVCE